MPAPHVPSSVETQRSFASDELVSTEQADRIPCPRCQKVGFVRIEHVIKAGQATRQCFCGACDYGWEVAGDGQPVSVFRT